MTREDIDRIASEYFNDKESEHEMDEVFDLAKKSIEERKENVLDKIRSEIDEQYDRVHPYNTSYAEGVEMALEIIDKYRELIGAEGMKEDVFAIIRYALAEPKKETGSFEERNFSFNFVAEKGLDNAIEDINNYILSKYCGEEQKE